MGESGAAVSATSFTNQFQPLVEPICRSCCYIPQHIQHLHPTTITRSHFNFNALSLYVCARRRVCVCVCEGLVEKLAEPKNKQSAKNNQEQKTKTRDINFFTWFPNHIVEHIHCPHQFSLCIERQEYKLQQQRIASITSPITVILRPRTGPDRAARPQIVNEA